MFVNSSKEQMLKDWDGQYPVGWRGLAQHIAEKIEKLPFGVEVAQIKEKFGGLRFYYISYGYGDNIAPKPNLLKEEQEQFKNFIDKMEWASYLVCQDCGTTLNVKRRDSNWISTRCDKCFSSIITRGI